MRQNVSSDLRQDLFLVTELMNMEDCAVPMSESVSSDLRHDLFLVTELMNMEKRKKSLLVVVGFFLFRLEGEGLWSCGGVGAKA